MLSKSEKKCPKCRQLFCDNCRFGPFCKDCLSFANTFGAKRRGTPISVHPENQINDFG